MSNIFNKYYDDNLIELSDVRNVPLSIEELKNEGLSKEDINEYLTLIKNLYAENLLFNNRPQLIQTPHYYTNEIKEAFNELISFCVLKKLIEMRTYELHSKNINSKHSFPLGDLSVFTFRYPEFPSAVVVETPEEYRVRIERLLSDCSDDWYMDVRYNCVECFDNDLNEMSLYRYNSNADKMVKLTHVEMIDLKKQVQYDNAKCYSQIEKMATKIPMNSESVEYFEHYDAWFEERKKLDEENSRLEEILDIIDSCLKNEQEDQIGVPKIECSISNILYIYRGNIKCKRLNHHVIPATAVVILLNDETIQLNVEYCTNCKKFYLSYDVYEEYRNRYGVLIGNLRFEESGNYSGYYDLALESPLKLCGYNVGQKDSFSSQQRKFILSSIIHNKIMTKLDVIRYLSYFIKMNGARLGNDLAVEKWREDLRFVQEYNINVQPKTFVSEIKKY